MPLEPGQPRPVIHKRIRTAFPLSPKKLMKDGMIKQDKVHGYNNTKADVYIFYIEMWLVSVAASY